MGRVKGGRPPKRKPRREMPYAVAGTLFDVGLTSEQLAELDKAIDAELERRNG